MIGPARKTAELTEHLQSITRELAQWREAAGEDGRPLWRHHTQIEAIAGALDEVARLVGNELEAAGGGDWIFERAPDVERKILDLHRLWGFFRDKLALRYVPAFQDALLVADDLAWACYEPAQQRLAEDSRREPPLVYFSGGSTPHLMPRGAPYTVAPLPDGGVRPVDFAELVDGMPIALVGLPWFEVEHVPDLPVVAHEVGHAVERDLALEDGVERLLVGAVAPGHREAWRGWRQEVFADLYGVLALGPGYAGALAGLLAAHPRDVEGEWRSPDAWGAYPTRTLRVKLVAEAVRTLGFGEHAGELWSAWRSAYPTHHHAALEPDVEPAVKALLTGRHDALCGEPLTAILTFGPAEQTSAASVAARLNDGLRLTKGQIRPLIAGARLAYDRPSERYDARRASAAVRARAAAIQTFVKRTAEAEQAPPEPVRSGRDKLAGRGLFALLNRAETDQEEPDVQAQ
jgi:hypothetical protein